MPFGHHSTSPPVCGTLCFPLFAENFFSWGGGSSQKASLFPGCLSSSNQAMTARLFLYSPGMATRRRPKRRLITNAPKTPSPPTPHSHSGFLSAVFEEMSPVSRRNDFWFITSRTTAVIAGFLMPRERGSSAGSQALDADTLPVEAVIH